MEPSKKQKAGKASERLKGAEDWMNKRRIKADSFMTLIMWVPSVTRN